MDNARRRVPLLRDGGRRQGTGVRTRGLHARRGVHPGRVGRGSRVLRGGGVLRRGIAGAGDVQADGAVGRRGRSRHERVGDRSAPVRPPIPQPRLRAVSPQRRSTPPTTRSATRTTNDEAGRPLRVSPRTNGCATLDAVFGEKASWERVNWFASNEDAFARAMAARTAGLVCTGRTRSPSRRLRAGNVSRCSTSRALRRSRCRAAAQRRSWQRLCAGAVDRAPGSVIYTQLLNERGGIECDLTATRLDDDRYLLVTGTAFGDPRSGVDLTLPRRAERRRRRSRRHGRLRVLRRVGAARPRLLARYRRDDVSNTGFPFLSARGYLGGLRRRVSPSA